MKSKEIKSLPLRELRKLARSLNVSVTRKMTKDRMVMAIVASARSRAISATLKKKTRKKSAEVPVTVRRKAAYADAQEEGLPLYRGITKLVLMPRDPWWVFAYWEIDPAARGNKTLILRVYRGKDLLYASIEVDGANNWYINLPEPGESIRGEIGYLDPKGIFMVMAVSNTVKTPHAWPSASGPGDRPSGKIPVTDRSPFDESYGIYERFGTFSRREITSRKQ